jgi:RNA-binding protein
MTITGKARAALRADAHHLDVKVHIGHQGLTPTAVASVDDVLRTHELVKAQVAKAGELGAKEAANTLAAQLGAEVVQVIGRTFTLYRMNPELPRGDLPAWKR